MLPAMIAVAAGAQVVSGLIQYYNAEKARKAGRKRLGEIEAMFNAIVPPDLDVKIWDDPKLIASIPEPAFNLAAITPDMYERVGQYVPQAAQVIAERRPELVKASEEAKRGREAQLESLDQYRRIARSDFDPELAQRLAQASRKSRTDAQSRQASILQDAARRGQSGSLATMAMQNSGTQEAMQRQAIDSQMAAAESYRNKMAAMERSANLGGQVRQSEMSEAGRNADIINDFNQRTSARYQQAAQQRADLANQGQMFNLREGQRVSDANVEAQNKAKYEAMDRGNEMRQRRYSNRRLTRQDRIDAQLQKQNAMNKMFDNQMAHTAGKAGVSYNRINFDTQSAQDRNQAYQGVADTIGAAPGAYSKYKKAKKAEDDEEWEPDYRDAGDYNTDDDVYGRMV